MAIKVFLNISLYLFSLNLRNFSAVTVGVVDAVAVVNDLSCFVF